MLHFALAHDGPASMRYPKANLERVERSVAPIELGQAEVYEWGEDGVFVAFGTLFPDLREGGASAAGRRPERRRHQRPLRQAARPATLLKAVEELPLVVTVEEGTLEGGFGSAVLEAANAAGLDTRNIVRLGLPDRFVEHGERAELLAELGLDVAGLCATVRKALGRERVAANGVAVAR